MFDKMKRVILGSLVACLLITQFLTPCAVQAANQKTATSKRTVLGKSITVYEPFTIDDGSGNNSHTYALCKMSGKGDWNECASACAYLGGYLVTLNSSYEAKNLYKGLRKITTSSGNLVSSKGSGGLKAVVGHTYSNKLSRIKGVDGSSISISAGKTSMTKYKTTFDISGSFTKSGAYNKKSLCVLQLLADTSKKPKVYTIASDKSYSYFICEWDFSVSANTKKLDFTALGKSKNILCTVAGTGAINKGVVKYSTSDKHVATVTKAGKVTATGWGSCTVTITAGVNGLPISKTIPVTVSPAEPSVSAKCSSKKDGTYSVSFSMANVRGATKYAIIQTDKDGNNESTVKSFTKYNGKAISSISVGKKVSFTVKATPNGATNTLYYKVVAYHNSVKGNYSEIISVKLNVEDSNDK